jgi:large subunit ribosomal protein L18
MGKTNDRLLSRRKRIVRIRKKISGDGSRPRLRVFRSNVHFYAQVIDDLKGCTLLFGTTANKEFRNGEVEDKVQAARRLGISIARQAKILGIDKVVFDRGGYLYHGRVQSFSEGAREGGLQF